MKVIKVEPEGFASNSYILTADGKNAAVIDPSELRITEILARNGLVCRYVILTHGHFDHVGACGALFGAGAEILCGKGEEGFIFGAENRSICPSVPIPDFGISKTLCDGERINLCGIGFEALATPGHTAGSFCYIAGDNLFSGDTLFRRGIGRTDLPTGSGADMQKSLEKLFSLGSDYKVHPGHGGGTSLCYERRYNPYKV